MKKFNFNEDIQELEVDPRFIEQGLSYAAKKKCTAIRVHELNEQSGGSYDLDLTPLANNKVIQSLSISDNFKISKIQIDEIYTLENLSKLSYQDKKIKIDFSKLPQLEVLYFKYNDVPTGFSSLKNLKHLLITSLSNNDCFLLEGLTSLRELRLSGGTVKTLSGIEMLSKLIDVKIDHCSKLEDISSIGKLKNLENLYIEKCKLLNDFSFLSSNNSIERLFLSDLDSISFIAGMKKLNFLKFWNLKDGDLNPVLKVKSLKMVDFYPDKKHYSHTKSEINNLLNH
ncbi:Internalin-like protein [Collimonas arenae]|uniref:Internalin-like protein n=1 Tax=Collimonas arenae TaxID=279058 RepID=A0A0A1FG28_9BURK|nr:leucine-rich repeat domain-containing protein [Collimonas arenae]AIY42715.1 Internalin-like protein [Collimonas arenae]